VPKGARSVECLHAHGGVASPVRPCGVKRIDTVRRETLPRHEFEDFVFAYAAIAIWSGKSERLTEAKSLLQKLGTAEPAFNERRLNLLVRVTETLASGKASTEAKSDSTPDGGLATVSNFLLLEPNIAGIGININAIINYLARRKPKGSIGSAAVR
jgi:hypothetical protein